MGKSTITLFDYLKSELKNSGINEVEGFDELLFVDSNNSHIYMIMKYTKEVQSIVNNRIFHGYKLPTEKSDLLFKQAFVNRFLHRQIKYQTIEVFSSQVLAYTINQTFYLDNAYSNLDKFFSNLSNSETDSVSQNLSESEQKALRDYRNLFSDLPQDNINLNVDNTVLDYGTNNTISRNKDTTNNNSQNDATANTTTTATNFNIDVFAKSFNILEEIFKEFQRKCFLNVYK